MGFFNAKSSSALLLCLFAILDLPAAAQPASGVEGPSVSTQRLAEPYRDRVRREGGFVSLSLKEAIRLALSSNLDIAIEGYGEDLDRHQILRQQGFYDPDLQFSVGWASLQRPTTSVLEAGLDMPVLESDHLTWEASYSRQLPLGGRLQLGFASARNSNNSLFTTLDPNYRGGFSLQFTQPLWKGFIRTRTRHAIRIANLDAEVSALEFERKVPEIIYDVKHRYWDLVLAIEKHDVERRSMNLAVQRRQDSMDRAQIGVEALIEVTTARSEVADREQRMIQAEIGIVDAETDLKSLLSPGRSSPIWKARLLPQDQPPDLQPLGQSLESAVEKALLTRPEIKQIEKELAKAAVDERFYRRQGKPQIDLGFGLASLGVAGTGFQPVLGGSEPDPDNPLQGNYGDALSRAIQFDFTSYTVSLNVRIPLGNRVNQADMADVRIRRERLRRQLEKVRQGIEAEVTKAYRAIEIQEKRLKAARIACQLAEESLEGENERLAAGLSTNFAVLRLQRDVAHSRINELEAKVSYAKALLALERAMHQLVSESDLQIAREQE